MTDQDEQAMARFNDNKELNLLLLTKDILSLVRALSNTTCNHVLIAIDMKKSPDLSKTSRVSPTQPGLSSDEIFNELEIPQRTQLPPTEELTARLNKLASKPPFSYTRKVKKNYPL